MLSFIKKSFCHHKTQATLFMIFSIMLYMCLLTYNPEDPSLNLSTPKYPSNLLGYYGAYISDLLYQTFGVAILILPTCFLSWSYLLYNDIKIRILYIKIPLTLLCISFTSVFLYKNNLSIVSDGVIISILNLYLDDYMQLPFINAGLFSMALVMLFMSLGMPIRYYIKAIVAMKNIIKKSMIIKASDSKPILSSSVLTNNNFVQNVARNIAPDKSNQQRRNTDDESIIPPLDLLNLSNAKQNITNETPAELDQRGQDLLKVLGDFGIKGNIIDIRQGPVVTLYEFEPAAGTKSSRIIGLSDDIARSLSAVSTRIATIPGRNVLGIELPNKRRAFFCLRELIDTDEYRDHNMHIPIILGKDLGGDPCIVDLAKMPHLLIAGTTGSGKSVAINTMIMSILYRYSPEQCRLIMIDPKMLELSIYDNIPHLLTPVVTEPNKAVVALKWAVKEMTDRYRLMSNLGVRNISGYNAKIMDSIANGKTLERMVQTGFDQDTGQPIYESMPVKMEKLPFIVIIVDEMADLMMVAGKDIESSIQRLAQMARAAGIHIIMATQRPSVDVITGVIKANFPSRVSFKVTSKIDSRTILGEQGAEQLLGMGDMLYMANQIIRVHGPFVDDIEVAKVTSYLKKQGMPEYISAVTEQTEAESIETIDTNNSNGDDDLYTQALNIIKKERKVSISYIQRCLKIGYNRSANIIEKMEKEGIISVPSHSGKREVLLPKN